MRVRPAISSSIDRRYWVIGFIVFVFALAWARPSSAQQEVPIQPAVSPSGDKADQQSKRDNQGTTNPVPSDIKVVEKIGANLALELHVTDDTGVSRPLKSFFSGKLPAVFIPVYYGCPLLCTVTLNRFIDALKTVPYKVGIDFNVLAFSIDPERSQS